MVLPIKNKHIKFLFLILTCLSCCFWSTADELNPEMEEAVRKKELEEIEQSLVAIKKWQGKYIRQRKNYEQRANRIQFKNAFEAKKIRGHALNAKENSDVLQAQIDMLLERKKDLTTKQQIEE